MRSGDVEGAMFDPTTHRRFAVAWRHTGLRRVFPVAVFDYDGQTYTFHYVPDVATVPDFQPLIGFPEFDRTYQSRRLWPFFASRVMDRRRPDFPQYLAWFGLPPDATHLDILSRSAGEQIGGTVQVIEQPVVSSSGNTVSTFLVRGARYATEQHCTASAADALSSGDQLSIEAEPSNPTNPSALHIVIGPASPVGWVPDLLVPYALGVLAAESRLTVLRNNGEDSPWHLRLLVQLTGHVDPGYRAFTGPGWPPLGAPGDPVATG